MKRLVSVLALAGFVAMGFSACGDDDGDGGSTIASQASAYIQATYDVYSEMCTCMSDATSDVCTNEDTTYLCFNTHAECMETIDAPENNYQLTDCEKNALELNPTGTQAFLTCANTGLSAAKTCFQAAACNLTSFDTCLESLDTLDCTIPTDVSAALELCE